MADPYYDGYPGVDENFLFPPEVMAAIAGSKELTAVADRLIQSYTKAISDNNRKQFGSGEADPTAPEDLIAGRLFYNTADQATKQYNGKAWQVVGGPVKVAASDVFDFTPNYNLAVNTDDASEVFVTGKRIDFHVAVVRKPALPNGIPPGEIYMNPKGNYRGIPNTSIPLPSIQAGNGQAVTSVTSVYSTARSGFYATNTGGPGKLLIVSGTYYRA